MSVVVYKEIIFLMVQEVQEHGINVDFVEKPMLGIPMGLQKQGPYSESRIRDVGRVWQ